MSEIDAILDKFLPPLPTESKLLIEFIRADEWSPRKRATVLRGFGIECELLGQLDDAISAYRSALSLYPRIGVARRLERLLHTRRSAVDAGNYQT